MTDPNAAHLKHLAAIEAALEAEFGVTPAISALFTALGYGFECSADELPARAAREYQGPASLSEEHCRLALSECLSRSWLRVLSENDLAEIARELAAGGFLGPIYGPLPHPGCVDFTELGLAVLENTQNRFKGHEKYDFTYSEVVFAKSTRYFRTREQAQEAACEMASDEEVSVGGPHPIGAWRAQWWRRFSEGYRIDFERRSVWRGHACGVHESCSLRPKWSEVERGRLQDVLDRHNVTYGEWVLLAAMESEPRWHRNSRPNWLKRFSKKHFGRNYTFDEYREAMEACIAYGWLRFLDRPALAEVHSFLEEDSAMLALPKTARLGARGAAYDLDASGRLVPAPREEGRLAEIDFTETGSVLYRMIAAELLGPTWEDELYVENCFFCETHVYSTSQDAFNGHLIEPIASGHAVRASRVAPIGPWCVSWWSRFPSGYRLEMEISAS